MKKLKLLSLLAIVALLTVPANAANTPGRCAALPVNASAYCAAIQNDACNNARTNDACADAACNNAWTNAACNGAQCSIVSRCADAWGGFTFPAFLFPDANANSPAANPDSNTPAIPDSNASAPDSSVTPPDAKPADSPAPVTKPSDTPAPVVTPSAPDTAQSSGMSAYELEVVRLVNVERAKYGLSALSADGELSRIARYKSQDMRDKGYFSHESPTYGSPFQMLKSFGVSYRSAGENIAYGYATPEKVVNAWMNSEGHRANILNASYTRLGVGYVASGDYWTQLFVG